MTVSEAFEKFIYDKRLAGLKDTSIKDYDFQLRQFFQFVGSSVDISDLSKSLVESYILSVNRSKLSKGTKHSYIRSLRIFLLYLSEEFGYDLMNPSKIVVPKMPKKSLKIYTDEEVIQIFGAIRNNIQWIQARDKAIVALMLDSGIRQMEVAGLRWSDIQMNANRMTVHGKGDKERYVPLGNTSRYLLEQYDKLCVYKKTDTVFRAVDGMNLSNNAIKLMISRINRQLPFEMSSHKLRHNFATNYCIEQMEKYGHIDSLSLKVLMGHESLQTTEKYIHFAYSLLATKYCDSRLDKLTDRLSL